MVSSINFALKSEEEQTAIIYAFQSFLNSLDFFCQIVIQSRNINITPYLDGLKDLEEKAMEGKQDSALPAKSADPPPEQIPPAAGKSGARKLN